MYSAGSATLTSKSAAQSPLSCIGIPYGLESLSRFSIVIIRGMTVSSTDSSNSILSIIKWRRASVSFGTCSMFTGQTSTQALHVVHAQIAASPKREIISSSGASPLNNNSECSLAYARTSWTICIGFNAFPEAYAGQTS